MNTIHWMIAHWQICTGVLVALAVYGAIEDHKDKANSTDKVDEPTASRGFQGFKSNMAPKGIKSYTVETMFPRTGQWQSRGSSTSAGQAMNRANGLRSSNQHIEACRVVEYTDGKQTSSWNV